MTARHRSLCRSIVVIGGASVALFLASCSFIGSGSSDDEPDESSSGNLAEGDHMPDQNAPQISLIPPGTVIGSKAPTGWTHLISKSKPKIEYGDVDQVPDKIKTLSGMFFTAMLARVRPPAGENQSGYELEDVAINLGTKIGDQDTVITPDTQKKLGAGLGFLAKMALDRGYERLQNVRITAHTKTMVIIDGPAMMVRDDKHKPVMVRYAILVDPKTGRLETLLWTIGQDQRGAYQEMLGACEWLKPDMIDDRLMHVDASEFSFGLITENALAMVNLFKGHTQITFPPEVKALAEQARLSEESVIDLEQKLWGQIQASSPK